MDINTLSDDSILDILGKISDFNDLQNLCKASKRIQNLCKTHKISICKAFLENLGYTNFSGILENPCKLMLRIKDLPEINLRLIKEMIRKSDPLVRFLSINDKIDNILYNICSDLIEGNLLNSLKKFYESTGYSFKTPWGYTPLISFAAFHANQYNDISVLIYILENGGQKQVMEKDLRLLKLVAEKYPEINTFLK